MIAEIKVGNVTARLDENGIWQSSDSAATKVLNNQFGPLAIPPSPSAGFSEYAGQAREAGAFFKVPVRWFSSGKAEKDAVY